MFYGYRNCFRVARCPPLSTTGSGAEKTSRSVKMSRPRLGPGSYCPRAPSDDWGSTVGLRFNPPPNWPQPPAGWTPPPGWQPDPAWGPAPVGWSLWIEEQPRGFFRKLLGGARTSRTSAPLALPQPTESALALTLHPAPPVPEPHSQEPQAVDAPSVQPPPLPRRPLIERNQPQQAKRCSGKPTESGKVVFDLWGQRGWASQEVVGESHYLSHIKAVLGEAHKPEGAEHVMPALLTPEPNNPHDHNAVAVIIAGQKVGYLSRDEAPPYSQVLRRLSDQGLVGQVQARIWARDYSDFSVDHHGNYHETSRFGAGIRLDLAAPHLLLPGNSPPGGRYEMLPVGGAIQVTGEDAHTDILSGYCGEAGEQWAYATLHEITQQLPRSTRTIVEVRIDGECIGQLTPKMSAELLPAIRHLASLDVTACSRALVKGNRAAAEVTLYVKRSHQLDDAWFDDVRTRRVGSHQ